MLTSEVTPQERDYRVSELQALSEQRRINIINRITGLLDLHQSDLTASPIGEQFFQYRLGGQAAEVYASLDDTDVVDMLTLWAHEDLSEVVSEGRDPRAIGHYLKSLAQVHPEKVSSFIEDTKIQPDEPNAQQRLTHLQEVGFALDPRGFRFKAYDRMQANSEEFDREKFRLGDKIEKKAAISVFGYGILTHDLHEIFNHTRLGIILNEFDQRHIPALKAGIACYRQIDPFLGEEHTQFLLRLGIMGAQIRSHGIPDPELLDATDDQALNENLNKYLYYFFAATDELDIPEEVKGKIPYDINESWLRHLTTYLLGSGGAVNENSPLVRRLTEPDINPDTVAQLIRPLLDMADGNWERVDPQFRALVEDSLRKGNMSDVTLNSIIYACMGFDVDLPECVKEYLARHDGRKPQHTITLRVKKMEGGKIAYDHTQRTGEAFDLTPDYPFAPEYKLLSEGFDALPPVIGEMIRSQEDGNSNGLASSLLDMLFDTDGYYRYYFAGRLGSLHQYPDPQVDYPNLMGEIWQIVHPDIWKIIAQADFDVFLQSIPDEIAGGKVRMEIGKIRGKDTLPGYRNTALSELLPPEIYQRITKIPLHHLPLESRLIWTMGKPEDREQTATNERIQSSDRVRSELIPQMNKKQLPFLTQMRLIHRAHMRGKEHIVLDENQAKNLRRYTGYTDRAAGIIRSEEKLPMNIGFGGSLVRCASYENTPALMQKLASAAEELFPYGDINPLINEETVYEAVSAVQLILALIHPFYEANGRTSEDVMYALWVRRPDLKHTVRYVSSTGEREGEGVEERMNIINNIGLVIVNNIADKLGLSSAPSGEVTSFRSMMSRARESGTSEDKVEEEYLRIFDATIGLLINELLSGEFLSNNAIAELGRHLRESASQYTAADDTVLDLQ